MSRWEGKRSEGRVREKRAVWGPLTFSGDWWVLARRGKKVRSNDPESERDVGF